MECEYNVSKSPDDPERPCGRKAIVKVHLSGRVSLTLCQRHWDTAHAWYERQGVLKNVHWEDVA